MDPPPWTESAPCHSGEPHADAVEKAHPIERLHTFGRRRGLLGRPAGRAASGPGTHPSGDQSRRSCCRGMHSLPNASVQARRNRADRISGRCQALCSAPDERQHPGHARGPDPGLRHQSGHASLPARRRAAGGAGTEDHQNADRRVCPAACQTEKADSQKGESDQGRGSKARDETTAIRRKDAKTALRHVGRTWETIRLTGVTSRVAGEGA